METKAGEIRVGKAKGKRKNNGSEEGSRRIENLR